MRKHQFIIIGFVMIFFACKENRKKEIIVETEPQKQILTENIRSDSLFLSLSPNMSKNEFNEAKLIENGKRLTNGKFQISLNDQVLDFNVYQNNKAIELYYSHSFSKNELNNNSHQKLFNQLFSIFSKKYDYHNYADFSNYLTYENFTKTHLYYNPEKKEENTPMRRLTDYGFENTNYAVFNDSLKTVVIGFSTKKNEMMEMLNTSTIPIKNGFKNDNNSQPIKSDKIKYDDIRMFDFNITINYYLTKDFDKIKKSIETEFTNFADSLKLVMQRNKKNMNIIKKNKSEL
jgi:hypothetical protein